MPIRICKVDELTEHRRGRKPAVDALPELTQLQTKLAHGLKPYEAIEVELPRTEVKNLRDSFKTRVVRYLKGLNITDYEVQAYRANGKDFVAVVYFPPTQQMAA